MKEIILTQPQFFPVFFIGMWFAITTLLSLLSGWFWLMRRYPDRSEPPLLELKGQSAMMGLGVSLSGILRLAACPSGLRIGMTRIFGPFCRDVFIPWDRMEISRRRWLLWPMAYLKFPGIPFGNLVIPARIANRLANAVPARWPEAGPFPEETSGDVLRRIVNTWAVRTGLAAAFFTIVPRIAGPAPANMPLTVTIGFPAIVFTVAGLIEYLRKR